MMNPEQKSPADLPNPYLRFIIPAFGIGGAAILVHAAFLLGFPPFLRLLFYAFTTYLAVKFTSKKLTRYLFLKNVLQASKSSFDAEYEAKRSKRDGFRFLIFSYVTLWVIVSAVSDNTQWTSHVLIGFYSLAIGVVLFVGMQVNYLHFVQSAAVDSHIRDLTKTD